MAITLDCLSKYQGSITSKNYHIHRIIIRVRPKS